MSVSLRGNLKDFGIADVFQLIGQQRKTGALEISGNGERVQLLFDRGAVVSAAPVGLWPQAALGEMLLRCELLSQEQADDLRRECEAAAQTISGIVVTRDWLSFEELRQVDDLLTRETIFSVLRWQVGSFDFSAQVVEHDREFDTLLGAEQILMDGLRKVDEWQSFARFVPSEDMIFRQLNSFDEYCKAATGEASRQLENIQRVFDLVDGTRPVRRIIDLSRLGSFDSVRALALLHSKQAIESVDLDELAARSSVAPALLGRRSRFGKIASAAVSLLVLVVVTGLTQLPQEKVVLDPFAIQRPQALESVRRAHEMKRVRNALETYWLRHGEWPENLSELDWKELASDSELASEMPQPYYYANREDGAWLLAPDR
jgi:hypothetical protein